MVQLSQFQDAGVTAPAWDAGDARTDPVRVHDPAGLTEPEVRATVERFDSHGYAVIELDQRVDDPGTLGDLAGELGLGEQFVPPIYASGRTSSSSAPVTRISAALNSGVADEKHPSFGSTAGQALHVDGTLQDLAVIKSSLLLCAQVAAEGGATILFNATGAYVDLLAGDPEAAMALAAPGTFVREANLDGYRETHAGPGFGVDGGRLVTRYATGPTDRWTVPEDVDEQALRRGAAFLVDAARPGGPFHREFFLRRGQVLLLSNAQICHGRTAYRDSPQAQRCLYRSLHLLLPRGARVGATHHG